MSWHSATPNSRHQILFNSASVTDITKMQLRCLNLPTCEIDTTTCDFMPTNQQNSWRNCVLRACGYGRLVASCLTEQSRIWYFLQHVIRLSHSPPTAQPLRNFHFMRRADFTGGLAFLTVHHELTWCIDYTGQQNLTFFFGTRGKISNPNRTFNAEFTCVSSFSPSPTVCLWEPS